MNSPKRTAEVLVSGNIDPQLSPSQIISLHEIMHPTISSPERSQLFQESKLWHLGEHNKDTTAADITLATWQKKSKPATRIMADALKKQAFPRRPTSSTTSKRRKRKKKKKVPKQQAWSTRQPRGDLMKGLDGLTEAEAMKAWKESMGPQSFRLGKAKAAIQLYQKCVTEQDDIQLNILQDYELERYEHGQTQQKLIAQETLFADLLKRCATMEAESRGAETEYIDVDVESSLLQAASASTTLNGVMECARNVSNEYLDDVQRALDLKSQRLEDLEEEMRQTNRNMQETVNRNNELRLQLERMTNEGQRLNNKNNQLRTTESDLVQRSMSSERIAAAERRRRVKAEDVLAGQSGEVATFVHSMLEACKRHFGYVPPGVQSVSVFFAPNVVKIPFEIKPTNNVVLAIEGGGK